MRQEQDDGEGYRYFLAGVVASAIAEKDDEWLFTERDPDRVLSFEWVCEALGIQASTIRAELRDRRVR